MSPAVPGSAARRPGAAPIHWCESTGSTQDEARRLLAAGHPAPFAVATTDQRAGRGRLGRTWVARPGDGLALTVVHPSALDPGGRAWYPLVTGSAVVEAVADHSRDAPGGRPHDLGLGLKWPNDVLDAEDRKLAGILVEASAGPEVLVGIGLNLGGEVRDADGAAIPGAVDLARVLGLAEHEARRHVAGLARRLLATVLAHLAALDGAGGDAVASGQADGYRVMCVTIGRRVRVSGLGSQAPRVGLAEGVDDLGRLVVRGADGAGRPVEAGDVLHVRPVEPLDDAEEGQGG